MKQINDQLGMLTGTIRALFTPVVAQPMDAARLLRPMAERVKALLADRDIAALPPRTDQVKAARAEWKQCRGRIETLSGRTIRVLCTDGDTALTPEFVRAIGAHPDLARKKRWLEPLVRSYLGHWRRMEAPAALEALLRTRVNEYAGQSPFLGQAKAATRWLFSPEAADRLGKEAVRRRQSALGFAKPLTIAITAGVIEHACNAAVQAWVAELKEQASDSTSAGAIAFTDYLFDILFKESPIPAKSKASAVSALVCSPAADRDEAVRDNIKRILLSHPEFGDPRLPAHAAHWALCTEAARARLTSWLARRDLHFFFEAVITNDTQGRKAFWLKYVDSVVNSSVALSASDSHRLWARLRKEALVPARTDSQTASAFIMQFRGHGKFVVVEFSESGNAAYIHDLAAFLEGDRSINQRRFAISSDLKRPPVERFVHREGWESRASSFMARMGVRPR